MISDQKQPIYFQAVLERSAQFDGDFIFAVRTTGIYCRPSCPSRRPKPENIRIFANSGEAEAAGFRACLRCRPQTVANDDPIKELIQKVCRLIEENVNETPPSLTALASEAGVSPSHLQRIFKAAVGISPREYSQTRRVGKFRNAVKNGSGVAEAMYNAGFNSSSRLYEKAADEFGMTPATYARGGEGAIIVYAIAPCALGRLLVAATKNGICSVSLADAEAELESSLRAEFPNAKIRRDDANLKDAVEKILAGLESNQTTLDLPLDVRATAFQRRVWQELRKIPRGETRSYKEIAEKIGDVKAVRAVARACAANPVALITPCHRVVGANGALSGFRWGVERKKKLLEKEKGK
jgi:AraC family transcriptional regulator of adaptative response/methylated-DNA-[protein]-cysteine methyltransferase